MSFLCLVFCHHLVAHHILFLYSSCNCYHCLSYDNNYAKKSKSSSWSSGLLLEKCQIKSLWGCLIGSHWFVCKQHWFKSQSEKDVYKIRSLQRFSRVIHTVLISVHEAVFVMLSEKLVFITTGNLRICAIMQNICRSWMSICTVEMHAKKNLKNISFLTR